MSPKNARRLRNNPTDAEKRLWRHLRAGQVDGLKFRRQVVIGEFIVDFACMPAKLIVEVDGEQHGFEINRRRDQARTDWLESQGYRVLRFWNNEVLENTEGVIDVIRRALG